jgi:two-component system, OmpR family, phosphate regulon sensor histidine kinase PhoR
MSMMHQGMSAAKRRQELQRAKEFYALLLGMAGHDLRQPLQVIQNAYDWLGHQLGPTCERTQLERGERAIARLSEQLDRLVGALRFYEHTSDMRLSAIALQPLFDDLCAENRELALRNRVELRMCPTNAIVLSDAVILDGILRNLIRNAIKYTPTGGRILIGCRRRGPDVRIDICDTGIGISQDQLSHVFKAFNRLDTTRAEGMGLGLYLVRQAVELLEHHIEVSSIAGSGSRFSIRAQAAPDRRRHTAPEWAAHP